MKTWAKVDEDGNIIISYMCYASVEQASYVMLFLDCCVFMLPGSTELVP
jgi:hypothetical protein